MCIATMIVPKVESGERADVPKVEVAEQRVKSTLGGTVLKTTVPIKPPFLFMCMCPLFEDYPKRQPGNPDHWQVLFKLVK